MDQNIDLSEGRLVELGSTKRAILIGVYFSQKEKDICLEHLEELENLGDTYGLTTIHKIAVPLKKYDSSTFIGSGKVVEIAQLALDEDIDVIVFDDEISPHQQRNLENEIKKIVIDRAELIIGVFAQRAKTKEAKLQVDLARLKYQMPRLKRLWTHLERQRGGGGGSGGSGYMKGMGESQIEVDKRLIKSRIAVLQKSLEEVKKQREVQRKARKKSNIPSFAIVGYTNAGKSTLMNALTEAGVFVEDKLFATLDTTTRKYTLPNRQEIVIIDTVGFIRKLPHTLIAAFKSTLEEAVDADILLHLIDVSNPHAVEQAKATIEVLKELEAEERPMINCLNKVDQCQNETLIEFFRIEYPKTVKISALKRTGFEELLEKMTHELSSLRRHVKLKIPQSYYALVSQIIKEGRVISCDYQENDILLEVEIPKALEKKIAMFEIN